MLTAAHMLTRQWRNLLAVPSYQYHPVFAKAVAAEFGASPNQVVLAWMAGGPCAPVPSTLITAPVPLATAWIA